MRQKRVGGRVYFQLVENCLKDGRVVQRVLKHLGPETKAREYCAKHKIVFERKQKASAFGFFNSRQQAAEFAAGLRGRNEIPTKFFFLREGAQLWKELTHSPEYAMGDTERRFVSSTVNQVLKETTGSFNLVDLGCGAGENAASFIEETSKKFVPKYVAVDISNEMLREAESLLQSKFPRLNSEFHQIDFEEGNFAYLTEDLREKNYRKNLFLFLTNTLGNVVDKNRVLINLRESMTLDDYLLIGIELFDLRRTNKILAHYQNNPQLNNILINALAYNGVRQSDGRIEIDFNQKKSQVEGRFVLTKDVVVRLPNQSIRLKKGKEILLMLSYKTTPEQMKSLLADTGFGIQRIFTTPEEDYALILCRPIQW